jgi:putative ABC transport system permease protein
MLYLALRTIRGRKGGFVAAFVAVLCGSAIITATGIALQSGIYGGIPPQRYAGAAVVVGAPQTVPVPGDVAIDLSERARLPGDRVGEIARVPGVAKAVGDISFPAGVLTADHGLVGGPDGTPVLGHGWSGSVLAPFALTAGRAPSGGDEVVLDSDVVAGAHVAVGGSVDVVVGSDAHRYEVVGVAAWPQGAVHREDALFFSDEQARLVSGARGNVDAVGVFVRPGTDPSAVADRIGATVAGVATYTGDDRGDAEFLDVDSTRGFLVGLAASFIGGMTIIVMFVVASTLALSIRQRRRELALLRAIAATPRQIRKMIGTEALLVSVVGAVLGVVPGVALASVQRSALVAVGAIPPDFRFSFGPLPLLAALVLCVGAAKVAARIAARRVARISPVDALGEAAVEPPKLGLVRQVIGWLLLPGALAVSIVVPLTVSGQDAADGAASSAILLIIAVALLGPVLLKGLVGLFEPLLRRRFAASGVLAAANARANSRRLSSATTPVILGITMAAVQIFNATTLLAAAQHQVGAGIVADYALTGTPAGVAPGVADAVRGVSGVGTVTRVVRTQVVVTYGAADSLQQATFPAQGVDGDHLGDTMNLDVQSGGFARLQGNTVALSQLAAGTFGSKVGDVLAVALGDGTVIHPRIVAIYGRGLGFGDVTLPEDVVVGHTTARVDSVDLVRAAPGADTATLAAALSAALARFPTVSVAGRDSFAAAQNQELEGQSTVALVMNVILLGYIAIAVVNTLVLSTTARAREFALLQLIGAGRHQVLTMMRAEATIVVVSSVLIGTLAAVPPLIGISIGLTGSPFPSVPPLDYLAIVGAAALLGWAAVLIPTRLAMRSRPVDAIGIRE